MIVDGQPQRTVELRGNSVDLIDQPALPHAFRRARFATPAATAEAIRAMVVRGAGAIGAAAAAGVAQGAVHSRDGQVAAGLQRAATVIRATRPTARNLFYGVDKVLWAALREPDGPRMRDAAVAAARAVIDEDAAWCERIGHHGATLLTDGMRVATHCNAGWLAFVDWGSALAPIYRAHREGRRVHVWVDETRPRGQGAQLTAWELTEERVPHTVLPDVALAARMAAGEVDLVIVGADRVAANGDVANKIGTYGVAVLAAHHDIPFYVAAPTSTLDAGTPTGAEIPIEQRSEDEVRYTWGRADDGRVLRVQTTYSPCANPAFDITPAPLIAGLITQCGIFPASRVGVATALRMATGT